MTLSVRDGVASDYSVFARLFPSLEVPDPLLTPAEFEERMLPDVVIAADGEEGVGYANWRFYGTTVHVVHVVVAPSARGKGVGRLLMTEVRRRSVARGGARWYLNVKKDNGAAIRLYERSGLSFEQRGWAMTASWSALRALPGAEDALPFDPSLEQASELARTHGLDPERLALVRARPGVVFVALRDEAGICALAAFDPSYSGVYPIAVARPEHARPLLEALAPHMRQDSLHLFVEGNVPLADALTGAGAKVQFELLRMGGTLP